VMIIQEIARIGDVNTHRLQLILVVRLILLHVAPKGMQLSLESGNFHRVL
jgi:hypothetical protein